MFAKFLEFARNSPAGPIRHGLTYIRTVHGVLSITNTRGITTPIRRKSVPVLTTPLTGATITSGRKNDELHVVTPAGTIAALTFNLPLATDSEIGDVKRFTSSQIISSLTVAVLGSGTVAGTAVTAATAGGIYAWECTSVTGAGTWQRIQ